ncbi:TetR/AcrR family transcriptional regulator [Blastococcus haudaquaticus]|uniref:Transcriptional regulator, TetR family n=1 Tax=Blastococcus haudaquaticus TaxID=1938745 RepID=A0A286GW55_9ACTN|nr:TetR/AcrR family transcriptional regulator [Blastococcus haudaquaticus]SOD99416.1 transcriptional regulator, TetR family [Blastococcus haudaquaticus]
MSELPAEPLSRRDRARADTVSEIKRTARKVLVERGVDGLALRAVAREMGMTAPGLYRYFDSREDLVEHVVADLYDELSDVLEAVRDAAEPATPGVQLMTVARAFRQWATTHHPEFGLLFGSAAEGIIPAEDLHGPGEHLPQVASRRFGGVFAELVARIYLEQGFPVPDEDELEPALRTQLTEWCAKLPVALPLGVMHVFLSCWIRLYGLVCMEVFGHLRFALDDAGPMFEAELRALGALLGVAGEYRPPAA